MANKFITFLTIALLLSFELALAARPDLASFSIDSAIKTQQANNLEEEKVAEVERDCEGEGKEECLVRRTLVAHLDYIYTQDNNP